MGAVIFCATTGCDSELVGDLDAHAPPWTCDACRARVVEGSRWRNRHTGGEFVVTSVAAEPLLWRQDAAGGYAMTGEASFFHWLRDYVLVSDCAASTEPAPERGGEDYGPTCNARFCLPEQVCALPPRHVGDHQALADADAPTGILQLVGVLQKALDGSRHGIGCASLRLPSKSCDCWVAEARGLLQFRRQLVGTLVEGEVGSQVSIPMQACSCVFVQHRGDPPLYERCTDAACEVHGRAVEHSEEDVDGGCHPSCPLYVRTGD